MNLNPFRAKCGKCGYTWETLNIITDPGYPISDEFAPRALIKKGETK